MRSRLLLPLVLVVFGMARTAAADDEDDEEPRDAPDVVVEVVGVRDDTPEPAATAASVTVIVVDERLPASAELGDVVGAAAGVHVQRLGGLGDFAAISVRGSSARQVEVYVDGVPLNPHGGGVVNLAELPLDAFERVEIYRSGAPTALGSGAMGGVVNLVTAPGRVPAPRAEFTAGSLWTGRFSAQSGFAGALGACRALDLRSENSAGAADSAGGKGSISGIFDRFPAAEGGVPGGFAAEGPMRDRLLCQGERAVPVDVVLGGEVLSTRNDFRYFDDHGTAFNLFDDRTRTRANAHINSVDARVRLRAGRRVLRATVHEAVQVREQGLPGIGQDPTTETRLGVLGNLLVVQLEGRPHALLGLHGRVSWRARRERYRDPLGELGVGRQDRADRYHGVTAHAAGSWVPLPWMALGISGELRLDAYTPVALDLDGPSDGARVRVAGVFGVRDDLSLAGDRVRVSPALQLHLLDNRFLGRQPFGAEPLAPEGARQYTALMPQLGLLVRPLPPLSIKANVSRSFRPPDFLELFGDRGAVVGNTDLVPERGWAWDAGVRAEIPPGGRVSAAVESALFWRDTQDAIVFVQNAQRTQIPINFGRARVYGVEAAVDARLLDVVDLHGAFTGLVSEVIESYSAYEGKQLPRLPAVELRLGAQVHWREVLRVGYAWSYTAGNYWDATNWNLAAPRSLHGVFVRVQPGPRWPSLELEVRNLTDERVQVVPRDPLNPDDGARVVQPLTDFLGYPLPGRLVLVTLRGTLPGKGGGP